MKAIVVVLVLLFPFCARAGVYKWVDEKGTIHFSDTGMHAPAQARHSGTQAEGETTDSRVGPRAGDQSGEAEQTVPYVLEGRIVDPHRRLLQGIMDEGARWSGKLDSIGRRMVSIKAYNDNVLLQTVHPDEDAHFRLSLGSTATHITLGNDAGGLYLRNNGPWNKDGQVEFSLDAGAFSVNGHVRGIADEPVKRTMVSALDESGNTISFCYTNSQGYFEFNTNHPISVLKTRADGLDISRRGNWSEGASVVLEPEKAKLFTISGVVRDSSGNPVRRARVSAAVSGGMGKSAMTDANGYYEIEMDRTVSGVHAYWTLTHDETEKKGPFDRDSRVDLVFSEGRVFTISGRVTDPSGRAAGGAFVFATDGKRYRIATTRADGSGHYELELGREAQFMHANFVARPETRVGGPWSEDSTVDIKLEQ